MNYIRVTGRVHIWAKAGPTLAEPDFSILTFLSPLFYELNKSILGFHFKQDEPSFDEESSVFQRTDCCARALEKAIMCTAFGICSHYLH